MIEFAKVKKLSIPEGDVSSIRILPNLITSSIDTDGIVYNNCGYMDDYRLNSSGGITEYISSYFQSTVTGFIPVIPGDVVYIDDCYWYNFSSSINYICGYDSEFNYIGGKTSKQCDSGGYHTAEIISESSGDKRYTRLVLKDNANLAYIRVSCATHLDGQTISGSDIKVSTLSGAITAWQKYRYTNQVTLSINPDGTIYNDGKGYKDGYRVRSGGAEGSDASASCTGYIPVNGGDVVRISGFDFSRASAQNAINASDASFTNLGQLVGNSVGYGIFASDGAYYDYSLHSVVEESTGVWKWVVPPAESGVAYIRLTGYTKDGSTMILTINEEI